NKNSRTIVWIDIDGRKQRENIGQVTHAEAVRILEERTAPLKQAKAIRKIAKVRMRGLEGTQREAVIKALSHIVLPTAAHRSFAERAKWLAAELHKRDWSQRRLAQEGGPDKKTSTKILRAEPVYEVSLQRLAEALSRGKYSVT